MALNNYQDADFTPDITPSDVQPNMGTYNSPQTFRFWCQKVLPLVYDNSLSYYELLCKVVDYLNKTMEDVNTAVEDVENLNSAFGSLENHVNASETALLQAYNDLQNYVNTYFNNLDVQEEINNKLDVMAEDGTLDTILLPYFNAYTEATNEVIDGRFETQDNKIAVLEARMNTFASLPDGSTAGDAELLDIRVGANGVTYPSAGAAVRGQVTDLLNDFNSLVKNSLTFAYGLVDTVNFGISSAGKWTTSTNQRSYTLPLDGIKKIRITANSTGDIIAFLNTYNPVVNESVDFATGYTARESLSANETKEYTITNGMNYMFVLLADTSGNDKTPTVNLFLPDAERLCDSYTVNYSNIDEDIFIIAAINSGAWRDQVNISNPGVSRSKTIKINDNTIKIKVTASANNNAIITCLKSYNAIQNETPDYATGWGRRTVTAGESVEFIPPSDAKYFYATTISSANVDMTPTVEITQIKESEKYYLTPIDTETQDETGKHDLGKTIELILREYGICRLSKGIYYVSSIHMPNNSILIGDGNNTVIKLLDSVQSGSAIVMGASCTVKDLAVKGSNSSFYNSDSDGGRYGIEWTGDTKTVGSIDNCAINGFSGAGIYLHDTTQQTYRNLSILGCYVFSNYIGIYIRKNSEFNKIANCTIVANHIGYLNRGGNNDIANCGIDANYQGIQIDSDEGDNNGHGTITGCSVNHSNHNNGYGLIIKNTGRMLVSNCNFYFSKFKLDTTNGNIISNCGFGTSANWEITDGECSMIIGCMVRGWDSNNSPVTITNNTAAKIINCYDRNGNAYEP